MLWGVSKEGQRTCEGSGMRVGGAFFFFFGHVVVLVFIIIDEFLYLMSFWLCKKHSSCSCGGTLPVSTDHNFEIYCLI